jgi:hypothetical protein
VLRALLAVVAVTAEQVAVVAMAEQLVMVAMAEQVVMVVPTQHMQSQAILEQRNTHL